jgi:predicted anti-sigma-YlaC factor YlaD
MLRLISCQQATLLVEQQADAALAPADQQHLELHLHYCPYCTTYAQQSTLLNQLMKDAAGRRHNLPGLSAEARQRLQQRLAGNKPGLEEGKNKL